MRITTVAIAFTTVRKTGTRALERIVVPLDGSTDAERAVSVASSLAAHLGAELLLLTTRPDVGDQSPQAYLDKVAGSVPALVSVKSDVVVDGDPVTSISDATSSLRAGVCMATHAHGGLVAALHSSVAEHVLDAVPGPVFLIGPHCDAIELGEGPILFAHDVSDSVSRTASSLLGLLAALGDRLELVTVVPAPLGHSTDEPYAATKQAVRPLLDAATDLGMEAKHQLVFANSAPRGLLDEIETSSASILVMASHHRSVIERLREGSTTTKVLHDAKVPVLVVRLP